MKVRAKEVWVALLGIAAQVVISRYGHANLWAEAFAAAAALLGVNQVRVRPPTPPAPPAPAAPAPYLPPAPVVHGEPATALPGTR